MLGVSEHVTESCPKSSHVQVSSVATATDLFHRVECTQMRQVTLRCFGTGPGTSQADLADLKASVCSLQLCAELELVR